MTKVTLLFAALLLLTSLSTQAKENLLRNNIDTTITVNISKEKNPQVQFVNDDTPIILRKGQYLNIKIDNSEITPTTVRVHSTLGRLVKEFIQVEGQINMATDKLLPGVYLIIIKQDDLRKVRKFVLTD
jgi:hypothetical protein